MSMVSGNIASAGLRGGLRTGLGAAFGSVSFAYSTSKGDAGNPQVGETWFISIANAPAGSPVTVMGTAGPSGAMAEKVEGQTDQSGNWTKSGQFTQNQIGSWSETWKVGGVVVGTWNFTVRPPAASGNVPPAALLKPMPTIIPPKPGQVSSSQMGALCQIGSWANQNPLMAVVVAIAAGWLVKKVAK